jgi:hypothetical protein
MQFLGLLLMLVPHSDAVRHVCFLWPPALQCAQLCAQPSLQALGLLLTPVADSDTVRQFCLLLPFIQSLTGACSPRCTQSCLASSSGKQPRLHGDDAESYAS